MEKYKIKFTKLSAEQLHEISTYLKYNLLAFDASNRTIDMLISKIYSLEYNPSRVKLIEEDPLHSEGIYRMIAKKFYIYFNINEVTKEVNILAIVRIARNQNWILNNLIKWIRIWKEN